MMMAATTAKSSSASKRSHKAKAPPRKPEPKPAPKAPVIPAGSLARRKRSLLDELRSQGVTPERQSAIRQELATEPLVSAPILSQQELWRLA